MLNRLASNFHPRVISVLRGKLKFRYSLVVEDHRLLAGESIRRNVGSNLVTQRGQQCFGVSLAKLPLAIRSEMQVIWIAGQTSRRNRKGGIKGSVLIFHNARLADLAGCLSGWIYQPQD